VFRFPNRKKQGKKTSNPDDLWEYVRFLRGDPGGKFLKYRSFAYFLMYGMLTKEKFT